MKKTMQEPSKDIFSLIGKKALLTGATGYFGTAFADYLLSAGVSLSILGRSKRMNDLYNKLVSKYGTQMVKAYIVDLYDDEKFRDILHKVLEENEFIDVLVNSAYDFSKNTGFNDSSGRLENISKHQFLNGLESGISWPAIAIQELLPKMKERRSGSIINICSMYAVVAPDPSLYKESTAFNPPSYGASKAGLLALTKYVASFYGKYGIRCNAILAGPFPNVGGDSYNSVKDDAFLKKLADKTVMGRVGKLKDLQGALIFLASDASSYITGHGLVVDGGWTIR